MFPSGKGDGRKGKFRMNSTYLSCVPVTWLGSEFIEGNKIQSSLSERLQYSSRDDMGT